MVKKHSRWRNGFAYFYVVLAAVEVYSGHWDRATYDMAVACFFLLLELVHRKPIQQTTITYTSTGDAIRDAIRRDQRTRG